MEQTAGDEHTVGGAQTVVDEVQAGGGIPASDERAAAGNETVDEEVWSGAGATKQLWIPARSWCFCRGWVSLLGSLMVGRGPRARSNPGLGAVGGVAGGPALALECLTRVAAGVLAVGRGKEGPALVGCAGGGGHGGSVSGWFLSTMAMAAATARTAQLE